MADKRLWAARNTSSDRSVFIGGSFVKVLLDTSRNRRAGNGAIRGSFDSLKQHPRPCHVAKPVWEATWQTHRFPRRLRRHRYGSDGTLAAVSIWLPERYSCRHTRPAHTHHAS